MLQHRGWVFNIVLSALINDIYRRSPISRVLYSDLKASHRVCLIAIPPVCRYVQLIRTLKKDAKVHAIIDQSIKNSSFLCSNTLRRPIFAIMISCTFVSSFLDHIPPKSGKHHNAIATTTAPPIIASISFFIPIDADAAPFCSPGDPPVPVGFAPAVPLGVGATPVSGALTTVTAVMVLWLPSGSVVVERIVELTWWNDSPGLLEKNMIFDEARVTSPPAPPVLEKTTPPAVSVETATAPDGVEGGARVVFGCGTAAALVGAPFGLELPGTGCGAGVAWTVALLLGCSGLTGAAELCGLTMAVLVGLTVTTVPLPF